MKIIVPLKSPIFGISIAKTGINLAKKTGSTLTFLHVCDTRPIGGYVELPRRVVMHFKEEGEVVLRKVMEIAEEEGVSAKSLLMEGYPHKEIIDALECADLLIMMTRVFSPERKIGDITEKVMEKASKPIMFVEKEQKKFESILVPTDGSEHSKRALVFAISYAKMLGMEGIKILYAAGHSGPESAGENILNEATVTIEKAGLKSTKYLEKGKPVETILKCSEEMKIDTIILGTAGKGRISRFFLGSVSRGVVGSSRTPVILVP